MARSALSPFSARNASTEIFSQSKVTTSERSASSCQELGLSECAVEHGRDLSGRCILRRIQKQKIQSQRIARQSQHPAQLAGAHDTYGHTL